MLQLIEDDHEICLIILNLSKSLHWKQNTDPWGSVGVTCTQDHSMIRWPATKLKKNGCWSLTSKFQLIQHINWLSLSYSECQNKMMELLRSPHPPLKFLLYNTLFSLPMPFYFLLFFLFSFFFFFLHFLNN